MTRKRSTNVIDSASIDNILAVYDEAVAANGGSPSDLAGLWYAQARQWAHKVAAKHGYTVEVTVAVCAAISPRQRWSKNKEFTERILSMVNRGQSSDELAGVMRNFKNKAFLIAQTGDTSLLSGPKVTSFAQNILGCTDTVTLDTHAIRIVTGYKYERAHNADYDLLADMYRRAAQLRGVSPHKMQSVTWQFAVDNYRSKLDSVKEVVARRRNRKASS